MRDDTIRYEAREDVFKTRFSRWAPDELEGLAWGDATEAQRARYLFWARADGTMAADGETGSAWL